MLGWFKKKFGKQPAPVATEPELAKAALEEAAQSPAIAAPQAEPAV